MPTDLYEIILLVFNQEKVVLNGVKGRIPGTKQAAILYKQTLNF